MKPTLKVLSLAVLLPLASNAATILIDFGSSATTTAGSGWNNLTEYGARSNLALVDSAGSATSVTISYEAFIAVNTAGVATTTAPASDIFSGTVAQDSFYSYAVSAGDFTTPIPTVTITFSGLSVSQEYQFTYFASRNGVADNRETLYSLTNGNDSSAVALNAANNSGSVVSSTFLSPAGDGTLALILSAGPNNNNGNKFFFIGGLQIISQASAVPEPASFAALAGLVCLGLVASRRRRSA